jgi:phosphate starvation-inducible PhoH-like protein
MKLLLTRLGEGSKMCLTGDPDQTDLTLKKRELDGLSDLVKRVDSCANLEYIRTVRLKIVDIQREPSVREVLQIYKK